MMLFPSHRTLILGAAFALGLGAGAADAEVAADDQMYQFSATYTGELWRNAHGGLRRGSRYLDNLDVQLEINGERAWGLRGLKVFAYGLYTNGHELSGTLIGDAQAASNIEAATHPFLYEFWANWDFGSRQHHSLRVGLYDLNSEFDSSEVGGLFVGSAHGIGPQIAQTGVNGPSIFPVTSFGMRLRLAPAEGWEVLLAALDAVPGDPEHPRRSRIEFGGRDGLLFVGEAARTFSSDARVALGAWQYSAQFDDLIHVDAGGEPRQRRDNRGAYVLGEMPLWSSQQGTPRVLAGYVRAGTATAGINRFDRFFGGGLMLTGPLARRPEDQLGLGIVVAGNGRPYREQQRLQGIETESMEYAIELTYRMQHDALAFQPVVQYIVNPDTNPQIANALAFALRFSFSLNLP